MKHGLEIKILSWTWKPSLEFLKSKKGIYSVLLQRMNLEYMMVITEKAVES